MRNNIIEIVRIDWLRRVNEMAPTTDRQTDHRQLLLCDWTRSEREEKKPNRTRNIKIQRFARRIDITWRGREEGRVTDTLERVINCPI